MTNIGLAVFFGILEGVTEWLPISSTGHLILLADWLSMQWSAAFWDVFLTCVQLGAILAVAIRFFVRLCPLTVVGGRLQLKRETLCLLAKILLACAPAAVVGVLYGETLEARFYHPITIACMLIALGIVFVIEKRITARISVKYTEAEALPIHVVIWIGMWQLLAAIFPGTSRSGATMLGGMLCGVSAVASAEFSFLLGVPVMLGASALKLWEHGAVLSLEAWGILVIGAAVACLVSLAVIDGLLAYLKQKGLAAFGWYRIFLGVAVLCGIAF